MYLYTTLNEFKLNLFEEKLHLIELDYYKNILALANCCKMLFTIYEIQKHNMSTSDTRF